MDRDRFGLDREISSLMDGQGIDLGLSWLQDEIGFVNSYHRNHDPSFSLPLDTGFLLIPFVFPITYSDLT